MSTLEPILNSADNGLALAQRILEDLQHAETVTLDFTDVDRATPSFANALVMTLLEQLPLPELRRRLQMVNRNSYVAHIINESAERFQRGIRLSTQRPLANSIKGEVREEFFDTKLGEPWSPQTPHANGSEARGQSSQ